MPSILAVFSIRSLWSWRGFSSFSGKPMLARFVMVGYSAKFWKTMAMERSRGVRWLAGSPSSSTSPSETSSRPAIMRSTVDLPQPEGPSRTTNSPGSMESERRSTAREDRP